MRELGIKGCTPYKSKRTTIPDKNACPKPDLIKRNFTSPVPTYKLVGDITHLKTKEGWLYLSTVIDLNTRMVVGWSLSTHMTADIVVNELELVRRQGYIKFIESYYNRRRPYSLIDYKIPAKVMNAFFERTKPKPEENQASLNNAA